MANSENCYNKLDRGCRLPAASFILVFILSLIVPSVALATPGTWSLTAPLNSQGASTATLMRDGRVMVVGTGPHREIPEIYDPALRGWSEVTSLGEDGGRFKHTATLLPDGNVLVAGGEGFIYPGYHSSSPIYETPTGLWSWYSMATPRAAHTATLLTNGNVLVAGGYNVGGTTSVYLNKAEIFDSSLYRWASQLPMGTHRCDHSATLLTNGKVLVAGGYNSTDLYLASAELYDPVYGTWSGTGSMIHERAGHSATLLGNGKVLVAGGRDASSSLLSAELYDPVSGSWSAVSSNMDASHITTLLLNGKMLAAGGGVTSAELYDPLSKTWSATGSATISSISNLTLLQNGQVLAVGWPNCQLYDPQPVPNLPPLLAFYPFQGNAQDASGNGYNGTVTGSPLLATGYDGTLNSAYSFNGVTDYITVPLNINPGKYPKFTMGCWANVTSSWPLQQLLSHDDGDFDRSLGIDVRGGSTGWSAFCGPTAQVLGALPVNLNTWAFVVVAYDQNAQNVKLQVNGQVLTKSSAALGTGQNQLIIGASPLFNTFFGGIVDDVFFFANALTDEQINYIGNLGAKAILKAPRKSRGAAPGLLLLLMD